LCIAREEEVGGGGGGALVKIKKGENKGLKWGLFALGPKHL